MGFLLTTYKQHLVRACWEKNNASVFLDDLIECILSRMTAQLRKDHLLVIYASIDALRLA